MKTRTRGCKRKSPRRLAGVESEGINGGFGNSTGALCPGTEGRALGVSLDTGYWQVSRFGGEDRGSYILPVKCEAR